MVLVKNLKCLDPFFFGQIRSEEVFGAVLDRKQAILTKKYQFEKVENLTFFLRGLSMVLVKNLNFVIFSVSAKTMGKKSVW